MSETLADQFRAAPYVGYAYGYPHKTAYRPLDPPLSLRSLWSDEPRDALSLYVHVPFCEMRCGFCNLFTLAHGREMTRRYLDALERQAEAVAEALGDAKFARLALGGGTPTYLEVDELARLFSMLERAFGASPAAVPCGIETSPETATRERLSLLAGLGVERVSIGVQSFIDAEVRAVGRPQRAERVHRALGDLRSFDFRTLNVDLIYGLPGQDDATWLASLRAALSYRPEEIYLYPLYVRPLTGLGLKGRAWDDQRLRLYRVGRDQLLSAGYTQVSMRMFRASHTPDAKGPIYCCQQDGMVGLGCGARSYTRRVHYSDRYAVGRRGVRNILAGYLDAPASAHAAAGYGCLLSGEDERRRFALLGLLQAEGLDLSAYGQRFGSRAQDDLPQLNQLCEAGLADEGNDRIALTAEGLELSDAIGPWLYSSPVADRMRAYELV